MFPSCQRYIPHISSTAILEYVEEEGSECDLEHPAYNAAPWSQPVSMLLEKELHRVITNSHPTTLGE